MNLVIFMLYFIIIDDHNISKEHKMHSTTGSVTER